MLDVDLRHAKAIVSACMLAASMHHIVTIVGLREAAILRTACRDVRLRPRRRLGERRPPRARSHDSVALMDAAFRGNATIALLDAAFCGNAAVRVDSVALLDAVLRKQAICLSSSHKWISSMAMSLTGRRRGGRR